MPLSRKPFSSCSVSPSTSSTPCNKQTDVDGKAGNSVKSKAQSLQQRRLTRQRRLRYLSNQDIGFHSTHSSSSPSSLSLPASPDSSPMSCSDHWSSSAVPQPLPLPESPLTRRPESTTPKSGYAHLGSSPSEPAGFTFTKKTVDNDSMTNIKYSTSLSRYSSDPTISNAKYNLRVNIPAASIFSGNSSCKNARALSHDHDSEGISNMSLHVAAKSCPTSVFTSPVTSPRRSGNVDLFDPSINFLQEFKDKFKVLPGKTVHSPDHSPLRSPGSQSPYLNPKFQEGSQHHKFLSKVWPENTHCDAHPLPLPPIASSPAQSSMQHQSSTMHHTTETPPSMKGQWQKGKLIGRGTFGSVYHATNLETGASCAMKVVDLIPDDPNSAECIKQLEQEIRILRQLHHPNIVQYYGSDIVGDRLYIYMEYIHPGSVNKFVREHGKAMTESVVRNFTRHILSGLAYLHSTKTIHRDIKGANLLVNESGIVKLADFGLAKILTGKSYELSLKGSPYWMAPEVMKAAIKNESNPDLVMAVDIWSLGCTIIEMLTGRAPWSDFEGPQAMFKVLHSSPAIPETLSSVGKDFLQQCFQRDPAHRPSAAKLLKHAFVRNVHDQDVLVHPQLYPIGDPGPVDNTGSPGNATKNSRNVMQASIGSRIFNKIQKLIGDTSQQYKAEESNHTASPRHSPVQELNIGQSSLRPGTLNCVSVANSSNLPLTVWRIITPPMKLIIPKSLENSLARFPSYS